MAFPLIVKSIMCLMISIQNNHTSGYVCAYVSWEVCLKENPPEMWAECSDLLKEEKGAETSDKHQRHYVRLSLLHIQLQCDQPPSTPAGTSSFHDELYLFKLWPKIDTFFLKLLLVRYSSTMTREVTSKETVTMSSGATVISGLSVGSASRLLQEFTDRIWFFGSC